MQETYSPGHVINSTLRTIDSFNQTVRLRHDILPFVIVVEVCVADACTDSLLRTYYGFEARGLVQTLLHPTRLPWPLAAQAPARQFVRGMQIQYSILSPPSPLLAVPVRQVVRREPCGAGTAYSTTTAMCEACAQKEYVLDPDTGACHQCPFGASLCTGDAVGTPDIAGSLWVPDGELMRIEACPPGYALVRQTDNPLLDSCVPCPSGYYSLSGASFSRGVFNLSSSQDLVDGRQSACLPCPFASECPGNGLAPITRAGFWRGEDMLCPDSACTDSGMCDSLKCMLSDTARRVDSGQSGGAPLGGVCAGQMCRLRMIFFLCNSDHCKYNGTCRDGHTGILCALCEDGWTRSGEICIFCGEKGASDPTAAVLVTVLLGGGMLSIWIMLAWVPLFAKMREFDRPVQLGTFAKAGAYSRTQDLISRLRSSGLVDLLKTVIAFYQILGTIPSVYQVQWPQLLSGVFQFSNVAQLNFYEIPALSCTTSSFGFMAYLFVSTLGPIAIFVLLLLPALTVDLLEATKYRGRPHPDWGFVREKSWGMLSFVVFLLYPSMSIVTLRSFNCNKHFNRLKSDYREPCFSWDYSAPNYVYAVIFTALYPIGVPLFMFCFIWIFVRPIAVMKVNSALLKAMINLYTSMTHQHECELLSRVVGIEQDEGAQKRLCEFLFKSIDDAGRGKIRVSRLFRMMLRAGGTYLERRSFDFLLFRALGVVPEELDLDGLITVVLFAKRTSSTFQGNEDVRHLSLVQLRTLCLFNWDSLNSQSSQIQSQQEMQDLSRDPTCDVSVSLRQHRRFSADLSGLASPLPAAERRRSLEQSHRLSGEFVPSPIGPPVSWRTNKIFTTMNTFEKEQLLENRVANMSVEEMISFLVTKGRALIQNKQIVVKATTWDSQSSIEGESRVLELYSSLFKQYHAQYWFQEIVEVCRKLFLMIVMAFIEPGSSVQVSWGVVFVILGLLQTLIYRPFVYDVITDTQVYAFTLLAFNLLFGLTILADERSIIKMGVMESVWGNVLYVLNSTVLLFPLLCVWSNSPFWPPRWVISKLNRFGKDIAKEIRKSWALHGENADEVMRASSWKRLQSSRPVAPAPEEDVVLPPLLPLLPQRQTVLPLPLLEEPIIPPPPRPLLPHALPPLYTSPDTPKARRNLTTLKSLPPRAKPVQRKAATEIRSNAS